MGNYVIAILIIVASGLSICGGVILLMHLVKYLAKGHPKIIEIADKEYLIRIYSWGGLLPTKYYLDGRGKSGNFEDEPKILHTAYKFTSSNDIDKAISIFQPPKTKGTVVTINEVKAKELIDE